MVRVEYCLCTWTRSGWECQRPVSVSSSVTLRLIFWAKFSHLIPTSRGFHQVPIPLHQPRGCRNSTRHQAFHMGIWTQVLSIYIRHVTSWVVISPDPWTVYIWTKNVSIVKYVFLATFSVYSWFHASNILGQGSSFTKTKMNRKLLNYENNGGFFCGGRSVSERNIYSRWHAVQSPGQKEILKSLIKVNWHEIMPVWFYLI